MTEKVALVTGASSGIGKAIVVGLVEAGYRVMAAGRNAARTEALQEPDSRVRTWIGDLVLPESCAGLVSACLAEFGRLDLLVNNAGVFTGGTTESTSDEAWSRTLAVNLSAPFYLSRSAIPHLRQTRGAIVNIASDWGLVGGAEAVAYCASKGGLVLMTKAMARDHAWEGIRVNAVCPGDVDTPMLHAEGAARGLDPKQALREAGASIPTGRVTKPAEVAALVAFLASDAAAQITGAAIPMDGGSTA